MTIQMPWRRWQTLCEAIEYKGTNMCSPALSTKERQFHYGMDWNSKTHTICDAFYGISPTERNISGGESLGKLSVMLGNGIAYTMTHARDICQVQSQHTCWFTI